MNDDYGPWLENLFTDAEHHVDRMAAEVHYLRDLVLPCRDVAQQLREIAAVTVLKRGCRR